MVRYSIILCSVNENKMRKSSTIKGEEFLALMDKMHKIDQPKQEMKRKINTKYVIAPHACSTVVVTGGNDPRSLSVEASNWLRDVKSSTDMDDAFFGKANKKLWK